MNENLVDNFVSLDVLDKIVNFLESMHCSGISAFKDNYLKRRVYLRAMALKCSSVEEYFNYLKSNKDEVKVFEDIVTINVSYFFRNPEVFELIKTNVLPHLFSMKAKKGEAFFKILSIGCASGEEPYSMALILKEYFSKEILFIKPYILGIDFDYNSIVQARVGAYDEQKLTYISSNLVSKYFEKLDNRKYMLNQEIKKMVIFKQDDFFKSDIKRFWDIIFCRNMLIYLNAEAQEKLIKRVHNLCIDDGYLVLGKSEALTGRTRSFFGPLFTKERIYKKRRAYEG